MFQGTPGVSVEWPAVLYPAPLPQYECQVTARAVESAGVSDQAAKDAAEPSRTSAVRSDVTRPHEEQESVVTVSSVSLKSKKKKSRAKGKKSSRECDGEEEGREAESSAAASPQKGAQSNGESSSESSAPSFYPCWKRVSSDTEVSDSEGNAQSKLRHEASSSFAGKAVR